MGHSSALLKDTTRSLTDRAVHIKCQVSSIKVIYITIHVHIKYIKIKINNDVYTSNSLMMHMRVKIECLYKLPKSERTYFSDKQAKQSRVPKRFYNGIKP